MNTSDTKPEFLLLFRNTLLEKRLSTEEMREAMQRLNTWLARWSERGAIKSGQPLGDGGKVISGAKQRTIADGPFAEAKEAVGGYVIVQADDLEEAMEIAGEWPLLDYDAVVEVRPIHQQCAAMERVGMRLAEVGV